MTPPTIDAGVVKSLGEKALIITLSTSKLNTTKQDKKKSKEVTMDAGAEAGTGRVYSTIIDKKHPIVSKTYRAFYEIEKYHKSISIPYDDNAKNRKRLLDSTKFFEYTQKMRQMRNHCEECVEEFADYWDEIVAQAAQTCGDFFDPKNYPSRDEITACFAVKPDVELIPMGKTAHDLLDISDADKQRLEDATNAKVEERLQEAMKDPWKRLHKVVSNMVKSLSDPDNKFKDSLVGNIAGLVELMPTLNIGKDPNLEDMAYAIKETLTDYTPKELRTNRFARAETADDAQRILDSMAPFMNNGG
jgi:hypothetical protein